MPHVSWTRKTLAAVLAAGSVAVVSVGSTQAPADLIVVNGRVFTGAGSPAQEALAIRGPLIAAVGTRADVEAMQGPSTTTVDARGASILPGFNDSHVHFLSGAQSLQELDLSGARTLEEVQQRIREFAQANPGAPWIRGRGWNYGPFPGGLPTTAQLDAALSDRPAASGVLRRSQHLGEQQGTAGGGDHGRDAESRQRRNHAQGRRPASRRVC